MVTTAKKLEQNSFSTTTVGRQQKRKKKLTYDWKANNRHIYAYLNINSWTNLCLQSHLHILHVSRTCRSMQNRTLLSTMAWWYLQSKEGFTSLGKNWLIQYFLQEVVFCFYNRITIIIFQAMYFTQIHCISNIFKSLSRIIFPGSMTKKWRELIYTNRVVPSGLISILHC